MTMKFIYSIVLSTCLFLVNFAQAPQGLNYQGVARNNAGVELPNQNIGIQLSILDGSVSGAVLYTETHALTTDANGLFTLVIGFGTPASGTFSAVNWAVGGSKWLKVSMDAAGGSNYQLMGTSQLLSVPYALFAGNVANNGGKQTLVLSGDVTDSEAAAIIAAEVGPNTQEIRIVGTTNLTTVNLSMITTAIDIQVANNSALTTLNLGGLTRCDGGLGIFNCPALTNLNLSALAKTTLGNLEIRNTGLSSINLNALTKCSGLLIDNNSNLTSINLSTLTKCGGALYITFNPNLSTINLLTITNVNALQFSANPLITNISLPSLVSINELTIQVNNTLTTLNFPILTIITGNTYIQSNTLLNTLNFPVLNTMGLINMAGNAISSDPFPAITNFTGSWFNFSSNKMNVSTVNNILAKLVSLSPSITGTQIDLYNQTPLAPPSGQGITDKATLITNGNNVTTD